LKDIQRYPKPPEDLWKYCNYLKRFRAKGLFLMLNQFLLKVICVSPITTFKGMEVLLCQFGWHLEVVPLQHLRPYLNPILRRSRSSQLTPIFLPPHQAFVPSVSSSWERKRKGERWKERRAARWGLRVGGEGRDPNDENAPAGDPDVVQVRLPTAAQHHQITAYNKMLQNVIPNVIPNVDGMYPLANFGPPPPSSEPILSKHPRKASRLGDGSAAYLVPSAEDLEKAEEIRKEKAAQQALKWAGNVANPGRVASKRYAVRSTVEFSSLTLDLYSAKTG